MVGTDFVCEMMKNNLKLRVRRLFRDVNVYIFYNRTFVLFLTIINILYVILFKYIPHGIANPLSIIWIAVYYVFWCAFYRYYYNLKPYVFSKTILGSLKISTKALFIMFAVMMLIAFLPMLPLLLGFDKVYLNFYESYIRAVEGLSSVSEKPAPIFGGFIIYMILVLLAPFLICRPYMSFIASLRKQSYVIKKNKAKIKGNYWKFVIVCAVLLAVEVLITQTDKLNNLDNWLVYTAGTFAFVYANIVFAKIYDFFYIKN